MSTCPSFGPLDIFELAVFYTFNSEQNGEPQHTRRKRDQVPAFQTQRAMGGLEAWIKVIGLVLFRFRSGYMRIVIAATAGNGSIILQ